MAARTGASVGVAVTITILGALSLGLFVTTMVFYGKSQRAMSELKAANEDYARFVSASERDNAVVRSVADEAQAERMSAIGFLVKNRRELLEAAMGDADMPMTEFKRLLGTIEGAEGSSLVDLIGTKGTQIATLTKQLEVADTERSAAQQRARDEAERVATIEDGFEENPVIARFNDQPAVLIDVKTITNPDVVGVNREVKDYIDNAHKNLPEGVELISWLDLSKSFKSRVGILLKGGLVGLALVFVLLMLFLRPRIAFWVCVGMFTAFMGTLWLLPIVGVSMNMISLFAFILVLGMVVDDAIIVGESIHSVREEGLVGPDAAQSGTMRVARPVLYAGLTTMVAFSPILFLEGTAAAVMSPLPWVVIITLMFSLIESYFILPAHLAHMKKIGPTSNPITKVQRAIAAAMKRFIANTYTPFLHLTLRFKFMTFAVFTGFWLIMFSFVQSGWLRQDFFPSVPNDYIIADITLTDGIAFDRAADVLAQVEAAALGLNQYYKGKNGEEPVVNVHTYAEGNRVSATIDLIETTKRKNQVRDIADYWRKAIGSVADMKDFEISYQSWRRDKPLKFVLAADSRATMEAAAKDLEIELIKFAGVYDITDTLRSAK
ncbi:MAG: efflux RND transporter permease subunit, partial [Robiginitomaculum sp.]|nr:efflux RND transporter permease subunit [Robiginitomaculum sp.]